MKTITRKRIMDRKILELLLLKKGVQKIADQLGVGKVRVREVRKKADVAGYLSGIVGVPEYPLVLFPDTLDRRTLRSSAPDQVLINKKAWIEDCLQGGWRPISIFEELQSSGITRSSFYRFLDRHGLDKLADAVEEDFFIPPIYHEPGEALILDWGKVRDVVDPETKKKKTLWAFVGVMGFSRYMMVKFVWTNDVPTTLCSIEQMFQELGGVPKRVTSDNPKCFSITADFYDPLLNPAYIRFSNHYKFTIESLPPQDPKKKGKVERMMPFVRRLFETYPKEWISLEHAQEYMNKKLERANLRIHGTTRLKPLIVFLEKEVSTLKPLPALAYESEQITYPKVRRDGFIRFDYKYYAVGDRYYKKETTVIATQTLVSIYCEGIVLEIYPRITSKYETHAIKNHLKKTWQKTEENNFNYLNLARKIGPNSEEFVKKVLARGNGFVDTRIIWGFLTLDKKYNSSQIDQCAREALDLGLLSSRAIAQLLALKPIEESKAANKSKYVDPNILFQQPISHVNKFLRPMDVYKKRVNFH